MGPKELPPAPVVMPLFSKWPNLFPLLWLPVLPPLNDEASAPLPLRSPVVICSPLPVGSGMVRCEHGVLPVPAPATAMLLKGVPLAESSECSVADCDHHRVAVTVRVWLFVAIVVVEDESYTPLALDVVVKADVV